MESGYPVERGENERYVPKPRLHLVPAAYVGGGMEGVESTVKSQETRGAKGKHH